MNRRSLTIAAVAGAALLGVAVVPAYAAWTVTGSVSSTATGATLQPPSSPAAAPTVGAETSSITVSWAAPAGGPAPTGYRVDRVSPAGTVCASTTALSCVDSGRAADTSYSYAVYALLQLWDGSAAEASASTAAAAATAPAWVQVTSAFGNSGIAVGRPAGLAVGDVMLAHLAFEGGTGTTLTPPSGWTLIDRRDRGSDIGQAVYYRVATSTDTATPGPTYTFGTGGKKASGGINAYTAVGSHGTPASPIHTFNEGDGSSSSLAAPAVTTAVADTRVVTFFAIKDNATIGAPPSFASRYALQNGGYSGAASDIARAPIGAFTPGSASSSKAGPYVAHTVVLRN